MSAVKTCRHLMPTGRNCNSPAMRGSPYCYFHGPQKASRRASPKPKSAEHEIEFEPLADEGSVACMANRIVHALAENRISTGRAAVMLQGLQTTLASWRMSASDARENDFDPEYNFAEALRARLAPPDL
ncbi:MAG: hypothetical protein ACLGPM_00465 [Acidobacteriota bacterium]